MDGVESPYFSCFPSVANVLRVASSICANIKHQPLDHPVDRRRCFLICLLLGSVVPGATNYHLCTSTERVLLYDMIISI